MRSLNASLALLALSLSLPVHADPAARVLPPIIPGTVIEIHSPFMTVMEPVLEVQGTRSLVLRFGSGRWEEHAALTSGSVSVNPPRNLTYQHVLVPIRANLDAPVTGLELYTVAYQGLDGLRGEYVVTSTGRVIEVGFHQRRIDYDRIYLLEENIPVRHDQTTFEAIARYNVVNARGGLNKAIDPNIKIDRSHEFEVIDYARAHAEADAELAKAHDAKADLRAERAVRAERGAGERASVKDAVRKGKDAK